MDCFTDYPAIVCQYTGQFPDEELDREDDFTKEIGLEVLHMKTKSAGIFNSLEWAVPTFLVVQILKPYFESMLKEAGKEHYEVLKKVLRRTLNLGKDKNIQTINQYGIVKSNFSRSISFQMQTKDEKQLKILFNENSSIEEWDDFMLDVVALFSDNLKNYPCDKLTELIKPFGEVHHSETLFVVRDGDTKKISVKDSRMMLEDYKSKKDEDE